MPYQPFEATISVDNFKLRSGPGFLFDAIALYTANEQVLIISAAPGKPGILYRPTITSPVG